MIDYILTGENIRKAIHDSGRKTVEVSEIMEVDANTVYRWQCGARMPSLDNFTELADLLGKKIDDFIVRRRN